jgi:hypothetical protein
MKRQLVLLAVAAALSLPAAAQRLAVNPVLPSYGQPVVVEVDDAPYQYQMYLPGTRYSRSGSTITIDYEYLYDGFGPGRPDLGMSRLPLGELAPGNYTVQARLFDIKQPSAAPQVVTTSIAVVPPASWGIYPVPVEPQAYAPSQLTIRSAAYFDPASMRASVSGSVIRVDFVYKADAPAGGTTPPGMSTYGSVTVPALAPGHYRAEGWGTKTTGGAAEQYFTREFVVASTIPVVEYYSATLDHYFMSAGTDEIALVDRGGAGDWKRTGQAIAAWARAADAPPGAMPVCRFYARGPNSHFYTGSPQECEYLKTLERDQRAESAAKGQPFLGWGYETIAFYAILPQDGQCPGGLRPVYRNYNNGAVTREGANHRFTKDLGQHAAMSVGWVDEGVQLCSVN